MDGNVRRFDCAGLRQLQCRRRPAQSKCLTQPVSVIWVLDDNCEGSCLLLGIAYIPQSAGQCPNLFISSLVCSFFVALKNKHHAGSVYVGGEGWGPAAHSCIEHDCAPQICLCMKMASYIHQCFFAAASHLYSHANSGMLCSLSSVPLCSTMLASAAFFLHAQALPVTHLWRPSTKPLRGSSLLWKRGPWVFEVMPHDVVHGSPFWLVPCKSHHIPSLYSTRPHRVTHHHH